MTASNTRRLRAAAFGAVALVLAACEAPGPMQTRPAVAADRKQDVQTTITTTTEARPSEPTIDRAAVESAVRTHVPEVLRAVATETAGLMLVVDAAGTVHRTERVRLPEGDRGPAAMREVLARARTLVDARGVEHSLVNVVRFSPGQLGPAAVDVVWVRELRADQLTTTTTVDTTHAPAPSTPRTRTPAARQ